LTTKRHFTILLWMPVRLSSTTPAHLRLSMMRHVKACVETHGGKFSTYYNVLLQLKLTN
jgi:hypothetical protein